MNASVRTKMMAELQSTLNESETLMRDLKNPSAGLQIDELVTEYMAAHPTSSYEQSLTAVLEANPDLAQEFAEATNRVFEASLDEEKNPSAGVQVDEMAQLYLKSHPAASYQEALDAVLKQNPHLAREFGGLGA